MTSAARHSKPANQAQRFMQVMKEQYDSTPVTSADQLKANNVVAYKEGHQFQGLVARILRVHADRGTVDLYIGSSLRVEVPATDLVILQDTAVGPVGGQTAP